MQITEEETTQIDGVLYSAEMQIKQAKQHLLKNQR